MRLQNNYNYQEFGSGLISSDFKKEGKIKNYSSIISKNLNSKEQEYKLWKLLDFDFCADTIPVTEELKIQ